MNNISVIIPIYNAERFLKKCLDSILHQTIDVFEIILINDGSTDLSGRICDEYEQKYNNIRVIHKKNEGVSAARNAGLDVANGDIISFIDADDCLENDMYELLVNSLNEYNADIAHCGYKRMSEDGTILNEFFGTHKIIEHNSDQAITSMLSGKLINCGLWNKIYKKSIITKIRFNERLKNNEDVLFNFLAFQKANGIVFVDETKYMYYEHSTSACNRLDEIQQLKDYIEASRLMKEANIDNTLLPALNYRYYESCMQLYRYLLISNSECTQIQQEKQNTKNSYQTRFEKSCRTRINYSILMKTPFVYKIIYKLYSRTRTPKWDVESK